jgi:hypothetical protein
MDAVSETFVIELLSSICVRVGEFEIFLFTTLWLQRQMDRITSNQQDSPVSLTDSVAGGSVQPGQSLKYFCQLWDLIVEDIDFGRFRIDQIHESFQIVDLISSRELSFDVMHFRKIIMNALKISKVL